MRNNKSLVVLLCFLFIATFWYLEKTKQIPRYGLVLYEMGLSCGDECGMDKQLEYFQKAVKYYNSGASDTRYDDKLSDAHYRSALIYEKMGNHARAVESFIKATELNQENVLAYYKLGVYYFQEEAYEYALRCFHRAYKDRINYPYDTHYYLAQIYDRKKEYKLAIRYYLTIASLDHSYASEVFPRVVVLYRSLDREDALIAYVRRLRVLNESYLADQMDQILKADKTSGSLGENTGN